MTTAGVSDLVCLVCTAPLEVSTCINIFYTSLRSGELLASFVLGVIRPTVADLQSSYLCSQCYNLFQMLEQAQSTVTSIQNEIMKIYNANDNDKFVKCRVNDQSDKIHIDNDIYQVPQMGDFAALSNETVQLISTNGCIIDSQKNVQNPPELPKNQISELSNQNVAENLQDNKLPSVGSHKQGDKRKKDKSKLPEKPLKYCCSICSKKWRTSAELKTHTKSHSSVRPYMCEKCGQAYKHKHALKIHIGMHNGINPFKCTFCNKCFTQKGALMRHLPMHTGEMPFQCELCGKRFVHHTSYNMHVLSHTGKKSYQCHICSLSLLSTSHLKRHMRVHTGERPYSCDLCGKRFAERYNLFAHQKIHDPNDMVAKNSKKNEFKCDQCGEVFNKKEMLDDHNKQHVVPVNQSHEPSHIEAEWQELGIGGDKCIQQPNYKDFDVIIRNAYQESFNVESI